MTSINRLILFVFILTCFSLKSENMQAYKADFVNSATLEDINSSTAALTIPPDYSSCAFAPPNVLFSVGFTSGLDYKEDVLYGLEWESTTIYLYSISSGPCAIGTRVVMSNSVGFANLESLAYCPIDDSFYSVDFDFGAHLGQLVRIDPTTGLGTLIGSHMSFDVRVNGMRCDASGTLWAVTSGFGGSPGRNPELLTIDRLTGVETLVGELGVAANEVESLALDRDNPNSLFAAGKALYEIDPVTGQASLVGGTYDEIWAMAGLPLSDIIFIHGFDSP